MKYYLSIKLCLNLEATRSNHICCNKHFFGLITSLLMLMEILFKEVE